MSKKPLPRAVSVPFASHVLTEEKSWLQNLNKAIDPALRMPSNQGSSIGRVQHIIDYEAVSRLKTLNVHHSAALEAKTNATVGLGHRNEKVAEILNPLCLTSWNEVLAAIIADYYEYSNGYLEVVRNDQDQIRGLHHLSAKDVYITLERSRDEFHYEVIHQGGYDLMTQGSTGLIFARFGERDDLIRRLKIINERQATVSEVIHIPRNRGRKSAHYGYPDWIAGTPAMELDHCVTQYIFDFFFNGGVPEAIYAVLGKHMSPEDWEALQQSFQDHLGIGNRRKTLLLNLGDPEITVDFQKLTLDGQTTGDNQPMVDAQALKILSAHRTPPVLAGVTPPGKMGANNETTNALLLFQLLVVGPAQVHISQILSDTLGNKALNKGLELTADQVLGKGTGEKEPDPNSTEMGAMRDKDFRGNGFHTILDTIDLGKADTMSRMRMSGAEAQSRGRDLSAGAAERGSDIKAKRGDATK